MAEAFVKEFCPHCGNQGFSAKEDVIDIKVKKLVGKPTAKFLICDSCGLKVRFRSMFPPCKEDDRIYAEDFLEKVEKLRSMEGKDNHITPDDFEWLSHELRKSWGSQIRLSINNTKLEESIKSYDKSDRFKDVALVIMATVLTLVMFSCFA